MVIPRKEAVSRVKCSPWSESWTFATSLISVLSTGGMPRSFALEQNYPNPFNPTTHIEFHIAHFALVTLRVYDVLGREVASLVNEKKQPGAYTAQWDASGQASGMYFCRLQAGEFMETKRLLLVK